MAKYGYRWLIWPLKWQKWSIWLSMAFKTCMQLRMASYGNRWLYMALIARLGFIWLKMAHVAPQLFRMADVAQYSS